MCAQAALSAGLVRELRTFIPQRPYFQFWGSRMKKEKKGKSLRRSENGRRAISIFNTQMRATAPLCGAKAKSTGQPCRRLAMANGRCDIHGGRTPKGDGWHKPRWPNRGAPDGNEKLQRKLADLDRARRLREKRLAEMSAGERAEYANWQKSHAPGSASERRVDRLRRRQNAEMRKILEITPPAPASLELERLERLIARLEAESTALERSSVFD